MNKQEILDYLNIQSFYASELASLKSNSSGMAQALCPFHSDTKPSLSINLKTGQYKCFGCNSKGSIFDYYMTRHSVDYRTAFNALAREAGLTIEPKKRIVKTFDYTGESGKLLFQVVRCEPKSFIQRKPDPNNKNKWIYNLQDVRLVPYNLPEVLKAKSVILVEGEGDVESLRQIGLIASTNSMGAGKWRPEYNQYFKNKKVAIIGDNDPQGKRHTEAVAKNLKSVAESVKVIELENLREKEDVSDWIAQGGTKEKLIEIINNTPEWEEPQYDTSFLKKGSDLLNLECNIEWAVDRLIPKQSITLLHGKGGIGKTWLSLILANAISKGIPFMDLGTQQIPVIFVDFENSFPVLVERVKKVGATDALFWHNSNEIRPPKLDREEWEQYKNLPIGLLIFDTLRASQNKDENDSKDMAFIMSRLKELRDKGFTIVLLHHTPKSNERTYKGSTAILDLADHVLSLHRVRKGNLEDIADDEDDTDCFYRFGTKDKTRYEPFHIFLSFDPERGFILAPDPDTEDLETLQQLMTEKGRLNQSQIFELVKEELEIKSKKKLIKLLRKGEGKYWTTQKEGRATYYQPVPLSPYIYRGTKGTIDSNTLDLSPKIETDTQSEEPQHIDNSTLFTSPDKKGQMGTDKTNNNSHEVIDLTGDDVEIIE